MDAPSSNNARSEDYSCCLVAYAQKASGADKGAAAHIELAAVTFMSKVIQCRVFSFLALLSSCLSIHHHPSLHLSSYFSRYINIFLKTGLKTNHSFLLFFFLYLSGLFLTLLGV